MQPKHGLVERRGHDTSMTRETVEEMIAAALSRAALNPRAAVRTDNDKGRLDQYLKKVADLEHQRDEALNRNAVVEDEHVEALKKIKVLEDGRAVALKNTTALENELEKALRQVNVAENDAEDAWVRVHELNDVLATKEAKIAHLESQLTKIHSLSKSDETVASTSARPEARTAWGSYENLTQPIGWGDATAAQEVEGAADIW